MIFFYTKIILKILFGKKCKFLLKPSFKCFGSFLVVIILVYRKSKPIKHLTAIFLNLLLVKAKCVVDCTRMRIVASTLMRVQLTILSTGFLVISLSCRNPFFPDKEIILQKMNEQADRLT